MEKPTIIEILLFSAIYIPLYLIFSFLNVPQAFEEVLPDWLAFVIFSIIIGVMTEFVIFSIKRVYKQFKKLEGKN